MDRRTYLANAAGAVGLVGAGAAAGDRLVPVRARVTGESDDGTDDGSDDATDDEESRERVANADAVSRGSFVGADDEHEVSGRVTLSVDDVGPFLFFERYEQTLGPDVYLYLTPDPEPNTAEEIDAGRKVPVDGGADDGESTRTGTFLQPLGSEVGGIRLSGFRGVAVWCDFFATPFGWATLEPVEREGAEGDESAA